MRLRWALAAVALCGVLLLVYARGRTPSDHEEEAQFEAPLFQQTAVVSALFLHARGHAAAGMDQSGLPLWLCDYAPPAEPRCGYGDEQTLGASVDAAMAVVPPPWHRLKVDFVVDRAVAHWPTDARPHDAGVVGLSVGAATILPSEVLELGLFASPKADDAPAWQHDRLRAVLAARGEGVGETFAFERLRTASFVEAASGESGSVQRLYRTHAFLRPDATDPDVVLQRAIWAAEALARSVAPTGRIRYEYDVREGVERTGYNLLRHAGSTFSLISAAGRVGHDPWFEAAERALGYLISRSKTDERQGPFGGGTGRYLPEGSHIKLGGAALSLVAFSEWQAATGSKHYLPVAQEFATFLLSQQQQSGEFVYFANKVPGGAPRDDTSAYYPGEAVLGLVRLHELDGDPRWLGAAQRGADWLIEVRDAGKSPANLANDHWLMMALHRLHARTGEERYHAHALRLAAAVDHQHGGHKDHVRYHRDYAGGYYEPPRSTPASTRAEGLVAVLSMGVGPHEPALRALLDDTVRHLLQSQVTPDTAYWMVHPDQVVGSVSGGIVDPNLRNDFTQHALSALLGTEALLRKPAAVPKETVARHLAELSALP